MRLWIKIFLGALALVLVLVTGAALFIIQADPNDYRGEIAELVEDATGRKLRLGGDLRVKLLPVPSVEANDVSFANAPWASRPEMVRAKRVRAEMAILPLLRGKIIVRRFVAMRPEVFLETDADGRGNWEFGDEDAAAAETPVDSSAKSALLDFVLNQVRIEKAALDYLDGPTGTQTTVSVEELVIGPERPGGRVALALRASYQDLPVKLDGRLGAGGAMLRNQPIEVDLNGALGDAELTVHGVMGKPHELKNLRLDVTLKSRSTRKLTNLAGVEIDELGPVDLTFRLLEDGGYLSLDPISASARFRDADARLSGSIKSFEFDLVSGPGDETAQDTPAAVDLEGELGGSSFRVAGEVGNPLAAKDLRLGVDFKTESTASLTALAGMDFEEIGPVNVTLSVVEKDGVYALDGIDMTARPRGIDASMTGSITNLVLDSANAQTKPAKVDVKGTFGEATYSVAGDVGKPLEGKDLLLNVDLETKSTRRFTELAGVEVEELGPLNVALTVIEKGGRYDFDGINLEARPRDADVVVKGSVEDVAGNPRPDLVVALAAKTLRQLDKALPDAGPVKISAKVRPSGKVIEIRDLVAKVGKSDLAGSATVDTGGKRPSAKAKLRAKVIDIAEFVPPEEKPGAGAEKPADGKVFPDAPLPLDALDKVNGNIELAVDRLITPNLTLDKVKVAAELDNGSLTVKPAAHIAGGKIGATIDIDSRTQPAMFSADVDAQKVSIGALTKQLRGFETSRGLDSNLEMKLSSQGDSVRALMGGLDGNVRIEIGEGRLNNDVLDRVGADVLTQIVSFAVPTDEEEKVTTFKCGVVRFAIKEGDAFADETLVMETEKVLLQGGGLIDLKTEELDLGANLAARKGIRIGAGALSSLMRVQGTLAEPKIGTDLGGVVTTGARIGVAVATMGLSLLGETVYGHVSEDEHPCQTALARQIEVEPSKFKAQISSEGN